MSDGATHAVRGGAIAPAVARAIRNAPGVFLILWATRWALGALTPVLQAQGAVPPAAGHGTWLLLPWLAGLGVAAVDALVIRWLLAPRRESLRPDLGLAAYVVLIALSNLPMWLLIRLLRPTPGGVGALSEMARRAVLITTSTIGWDLILATLALWPIALLMGDRISLPRAVRLMGPAYLIWIAALIVLLLPSLAWTWLPILLHHVHRSLTDRLISTAISTFTGALGVFVLAYIYARRVRGADLPAALPSLDGEGQTAQRSG
ncbi:MAG: hypothetical protein E7812_05780 [Phenylobacterium sp.]|nr:MAG: hypothetical protein E7812_05780 [Phenylobacterium sp.]